MRAKAKGRFIEPMLLRRTDSLPNDGDRWEYQLKFDGYRAIAFKAGGNIHLRSRNDNDFSVRYPDITKGLANLPDETVIDGEVIAVNALATETDQGEQRGFMNLLVGLFGTIRNPIAHNPRIEWEMSEEDALDILTMASLVHRKLDRARISSSLAGDVPVDVL